MNLDGDKASTVMGKLLDMLAEWPAAPTDRQPAKRGASASMAIKGRRSSPEPRPFAPMPLSPRMALLRNLAEDLHARWAAGDPTVPEERLGAASRSDLGILCGLLIDCAHPMERRALVSWLDATLSEDRLDIIPHGEAGGRLEDGNFFSTPDAQACAPRNAPANWLGEGPIGISARLIALSDDASQLHMDWIEGDREAVEGYLRQAPRVDLGILCSMMNELTHPLRRPEFINWLEAHLGDDPLAKGGAAREMAIRLRAPHANARLRS